ncbi:hypothetical protein Tco_0988937 [Tanacetum coccineum]|uniref:Uncharacterized protein n=1 Tax=Tanacetum coccineum TaxID=301880 RepID=A0ABQ5ESZ3_9ASTR
MLCKQESKGFPLRAEHNEWIQDTDEKSNELEAHYMYMTKIQEVLHATDDNSGPAYDVEPLEKVHTDDDYNVFATKRQHFEQPESINDTYVVEKVDSNVIPDSSDICDNEVKDDQNVEELKDERVLLASLIANLKLDVDVNKKIQKQLKKTNTSLTQDLKKSKQDLFIANSTFSETNNSLGETYVLEINWKNHLQNEWQNPITHDIKVLVKEMLIPLTQDTVSNASLFETHLKKEMFEDLKYVHSLEKEVDDLKMDIDALKSQIKNEKMSSKVDDLLLTQTKVNSDSPIVQLNKMSIENADLKAQLQDKDKCENVY